MARKWFPIDYTLLTSFTSTMARSVSDGSEWIWIVWLFILSGHIFSIQYTRKTFTESRSIFFRGKKNLGSNTRGNFSSNDRLTGSVKRFIDRTYPFRKIAISRHGLFTMSKLAIWVTINNKYYGSILFMFRSGKMNVEEILGHKSSVKTLLSSEVDLKYLV